jgi:hypothetical protein
LKPANENMDAAFPIYPNMILGRIPYHNIAHHVNLGITYKNASNRLPCELCRVTRTTTTSINLQLLFLDINWFNPTFPLKLGDVVRFGDANEFIVVLIDRTHPEPPANNESYKHIAKQRKIDSPENEGKRPERHEVGEESYQHSKEQTIIQVGNWSLEILEGRDRDLPPLIPITTPNIFGRNQRTPIQHHVNLGITEEKIPRQLLLVTTVSVQYIILQILREELKWLVKYQLLADPTWEQAFLSGTTLRMEHGDRLQIGEHTLEAKREILTITRTHDDENSTR